MSKLEQLRQEKQAVITAEEKNSDPFKGLLSMEVTEEIIKNIEDATFACCHLLESKRWQNNYIRSHVWCYVTSWL